MIKREQGATRSLAAPDDGHQFAAERPFGRTVEFAGILGCSLVVFAVFSHYYPVLTGTTDFVGRVVGVALLAILAIAARRSQRFVVYAPTLWAMAVALVAISVDYLISLSKWIVPLLGMQAAGPAGLAVEKLESSLLSVAVVLGLPLLSGQALSSLYMRRGDLRRGIMTGVTALALILAFLLPVTSGLFGGTDVTWARILPWTPWIIVFVTANAFNEELLFRGLLFGRLEPLLGKTPTNILVAMPFALLHVGVRYATSTPLFLVVVFALSLAWGSTLQRTQSLWGSVIFHAAADIPVIVAVLSKLG